MLSIERILEISKATGVKVENVEEGKGGMYVNGEKIEDIKKFLQESFSTKEE